ncbi:hypothetical protein QM716_15850 [Rhodococcus sp. IEGM 1409]|uniref:DUF7171 family protein n=1 Tax=Rhodococcus sp. IEGM 1409 TaxID=3047082 RepID=UPI0024B707EB|nr:hypothetical protein [Rhodococcus sp. IEGM 1409]MDI9901332.1 hypothetical protein [Rhodococcus sp. IEGM 1409]
MNQPLIDSARLKFTGISSEDFEDIPDIGEIRVFTIRAQCTKHIEEQMANEGTRKIANMKIERILVGVDKKIAEETKPEPSLFDTPEAGGSDEDDETGEGSESGDSDTESGESGAESEGDESDSGESETPSNVVGIGHAGPQFSAGD